MEIRSTSRYLDAMAVIIGILLSVLLANIVWQSLNIINRERQLREYHLASTTSLYTALTHLNGLTTQLKGFSGNSENSVQTRSGFTFSDHVYLIRSQLNNVLKLQNIFQFDIFEDATKRLSQSIEQFSNAVPVQLSNTEQIEILKQHRIIENLERVIEQLRRLHSREINTISSELENTYRNNFLNISVISILLIAIAAIVYFKIRGLIHKNILALQVSHNKLVQKTAEFEAMFSSIHDAVIYADKEFNILSINPALKSIFGYSESETVGNNVIFLFADQKEYGKKSHLKIDKDIQNDKAIYESRYKRKNGTIFIGETLESKIRDDRGDIIGFVALIRDITTRKQIEQELHKYQDHLEQLVQERTRDIQTYNQELESFSYSIAHDLRTPLRAIDGFSQIVCDDYGDAIDSVGLKYLQRVRNAAQQMGRLIDDVLKLTKVTRSELVMDNVDLSALVHTIAEMLKDTDPNRTLDWLIAPGIHAQGDQTLLQLLLENLLGNAWKYSSKQSHPRIEFGVKKISGESVYYVKDNGVGFDMRHSDSLFKPFHRLHTEDEFIGTGIGLATVQRIVQRHRGRVWGEAELNKGAVFYFVLSDSENQ